MPSLRLQRVRELLKREIGEVIRREVPVSEAGLISVNDVTVSSDLHSATVYVGILGNAEQQKRGFEQLKDQRKRIQGIVAKAVILKYTPQLKFVLDESIQQAIRVLKIIDELEQSNPDNEAAPKDN
jgi:ribosome-binding factor A